MKASIICTRYILWSAFMNDHIYNTCASFESFHKLPWLQSWCVWTIYGVVATERAIQTTTRTSLSSARAKSQYRCTPDSANGSESTIQTRKRDTVLPYACRSRQLSRSHCVGCTFRFEKQRTPHAQSSQYKTRRYMFPEATDTNPARSQDYDTRNTRAAFWYSCNVAITSRYSNSVDQLGSSRCCRSAIVECGRYSLKEAVPVLVESKGVDYCSRKKDIHVVESHFVQRGGIILIWMSHRHIIRP